MHNQCITCIYISWAVAKCNGSEDKIDDVTIGKLYGTHTAVTKAIFLSNKEMALIQRNLKAFKKGELKFTGL